MLEPSSIEAIGPDTIRIFDRFVDDRGDLASLRAAILALRTREGESVESHNVGGWKSRIQIMRDELALPAAERLRRNLACVLEGRSISASWAMVNERGARHHWHQHTLARLTGVLFVCADDDASPLELGDPGPLIRAGRPRPFRDVPFRGRIGQCVRVPAIAGRLVLFPGHVWHQVPEVTGDGVRISIAFDIH